MRALIAVSAALSQTLQLILRYHRYGEPASRDVPLYSPQLCMVLIVPTHEGMVRLG